METSMNWAWDENIKNIIENDIDIMQNESNFELKVKELETCNKFIKNYYEIFQFFFKNKSNIKLIISNVLKNVNLIVENSIKEEIFEIVNSFNFSIKEIEKLISNFNTSYDASITSFDESIKILAKRQDKKILYELYFKSVNSLDEEIYKDEEVTF